MKTFTTREHSLHDFFQTYLSDPLRHWFSDRNRPRHRTPGLPQIMLMHIMLWPCVSSLYIKHDPRLFESTEGQCSGSCLRRAEIKTRSDFQKRAKSNFYNNNKTKKTICCCTRRRKANNSLDVCIMILLTGNTWLGALSQNGSFTVARIMSTWSNASTSKHRDDV